MPCFDSIWKPYAGLLTLNSEVFGMDLGISAIIFGLGGMILFMVLFSMFVNGFHKCPPNTALIVFGAGSAGPGTRVIKGGGSYVMPLLQQARLLSLEIMTLEIKPPAAFNTRNSVPIQLEAVAQVKVDGDDRSILTAAEMFMAKDPQEIMTIAFDTIVGQLHCIIGSLTVEDIIQDSYAFTKRVIQEANPELRKMGLTIVTFSLREIRDTVGYIEQLGRAQAALAKQKADAAIAQFTQSQV